jgi:hypothetical protein
VRFININSSRRFNYPEDKDKALGFDPDNAIQAARNMPFLTKAILRESALTPHIIDSVSAYTRPAQLTLRIEPHPQRWTKKSMTVRSLTWHVPVGWLGKPSKESWNTVVAVLDIASIFFLKYLSSIL